MSCVNFSAALRHLAVPVQLAGDRGHLYDVEDIRGSAEMLRKTLTQYMSKENVVPVPDRLSLALEEADPEYFHHAQMTNLVWKHAWQDIDAVEKVFSCGMLKDQEVFVARQACNRKLSYYICAFAEGDGGKPCTTALTKYSRSVNRGVHSCGAVVGNCLYLLTEPANNPDIMLCLPLC
ncbi:g7640 [Coccomyxa elongata]